MDRLKACRDGLNKLDDDVAAELNKFSIDVKHFADYQEKYEVAVQEFNINVFFSVRCEMLLSLATEHRRKGIYVI